MIWVIFSLVLAALVAPWIYQAGKWLASQTASAELPGIVEWLGAACGRSEFDRFFERSLLLCALLLLPFLIRRVRRIGNQQNRAGGTGLKRLPYKIVWIHLVTGFIIAGGILWGVALILDVIGAFELKPLVPPIGKLLSKVALPSLIAAPLEEWLFRGVLLGLWLRFARPAFAITGISLLFAFLHFLKPPDGAVISDPSGYFAGFELLGKTLLHFTDPLFFVTEFATLFAVGLILAVARVKTGALWFSIGLHAGWIFAFKLFNLLYQKVADHPVFPWGVGNSLQSGLIPLVALILTAWVCRITLHHRNFGCGDHPTSRIRHRNTR